jgi:preprotein translocase subunit SecG
MNLFPIVLVIHLLLAIALVGVVLLQRSEGGALGMGGGGGGNLMTGRAAGNLLTRTTAILAGAFFLTSLGLAMLANNRSETASPFAQVPAASPAAPKAASSPAKAPAAAPKKPAPPSAPLAR